MIFTQEMLDSMKKVEAAREANIALEPRRLTAEEKENLTVGELMSTNVVIVNEDLKIANANEVMLKKSISRLIVADNNQTLLGIVTRTDLINTITNLDQFPIITN